MRSVLRCAIWAWARRADFRVAGRAAALPLWLFAAAATAVAAETWRGAAAPGAAYAEPAHGAADHQPAPESVTTVDLLLELENLMALRRELLKRYTPKFPDVRMVDREIRDLKAQLHAMKRGAAAD